MHIKTLRIVMEKIEEGSADIKSLLYNDADIAC
jgi:hypothetical protein